MKRFGDKDKAASDECYAEVAEKFATVTGKSNCARNYFGAQSLFESFIKQ